MPTASKQIYKEANNGIKKSKAKQSKMHYTSVLVSEWVIHPQMAVQLKTEPLFPVENCGTVNSGQQKNKRIWECVWMRQKKPLPPTHSLSVYRYVCNKSTIQEWPDVKQWMQQNVFQPPTPANERQTIPFLWTLSQHRSQSLWGSTL